MVGRRQHESVASGLSERRTPAGLQGQHGDKDAPRNWRDPPRPVEKSAEQLDPISGNVKWAEGERESAGPVGARKRGNARGAKGPCCSWFFDDGRQR